MFLKKIDVKITFAIWSFEVQNKRERICLKSKSTRSSSVPPRDVIVVSSYNCVILFVQADDRDDMLAWISSIQTGGSHDDKGEEVEINKDLILRKTSQIEMGWVMILPLSQVWG